MIANVNRNPVLNFLRQVIIFILLFSSIVLGLYLGVETKDVVTPPNPLIEYDIRLVSLYLNTTDWTFIHDLEDQIDQEDLEEPYLQQYRTRVWENYLQRPEDYRSRQDIDFIYGLKDHKGALADHDNEYYAILKNRRNYLSINIDPKDVLLLTEREREDFRSLSSTLSNLKLETGSLSDILDNETEYRNDIEERLEPTATPTALPDNVNPEELNKASNKNYRSDELSLGEELIRRDTLLDPSVFKGLEKSANLCVNLIDYKKTLYQLLAPRYKVVVYDSLQRVNLPDYRYSYLYNLDSNKYDEKNDPFLIEAENIFLDITEDPLLRLIAGDYLYSFEDPKKLNNNIEKIFTNASLSNKYISFESSNKYQEEIFINEIIKLQRKVITRRDF